MDLSKLPKLSQSPPPPTGEPPSSAVGTPSTQPQVVYAEPAGPEAFVSIAIGALLLLLSPGLIKFLLGANTATFTDEQGNPMRYVDSVFFQGDLAITAFAVVLIIEGLIIALVPRAPLILAALVFTVLTTLGNLVYVVKMMPVYGVQLLSAFAVVFGIYIAMFEWRMYQRRRVAIA